MKWRKPSLILAFGTLILFRSQDALAKCAEYKAYYCANAVFEKEMPDLIIKDLGKQYCVGSIRLGDRSVTAVFMDKQACPAAGASLVGHLYSNCQDTGRWTDAEYTYSREPEFCARSYAEGSKQAREIAAQIRPGMTRAQVNEVMKGYVQMFVETRIRRFSSQEYYIHPNIVLVIPFNEPNGAYSQENTVSGQVLIEVEERAQP